MSNLHLNPPPKKTTTSCLILTLFLKTRSEYTLRINISFDGNMVPSSLWVGWRVREVVWGHTTHNASVRSDCWGQLLPWKYFIYSPLKRWHSAASVTRGARFRKTFMCTETKICSSTSMKDWDVADKDELMIWKTKGNSFVMYKLHFSIKSPIRACSSVCWHPWWCFLALLGLSHIALVPFCTNFHYLFKKKIAGNLIQLFNDVFFSDNLTVSNIN